MSPTVSFVVPCYKLAHLLSECIESILAQTYGDFEVLIMDDCSPDNTAEVAQHFQDPRVKYVRNDPNLGHLRNYNKGIAMSRGKYVWLISADDRLRKNYVLEKYVGLMEANSSIGYVFCPGVSLVNERETSVLEWSRWGGTDGVIPGLEVLGRLLARNFIVACSGMARKACYESIGYFPLDMPFAGDWYMWAAFALRYNVGYFEEPMVNYRLHELAITNRITRTKRLNDNLLVLWRILRELREQGHKVLASSCLKNLASHYAYYVSSAKFDTSDDQMTADEWEESIRQYATAKEANYIRARVYARLADYFSQRNKYDEALSLYRKSLQNGRSGYSVWIKKSLLSLGPIGASLLRNMYALRNSVTA